MYDFLTHVLLVYDAQIIVQRDPDGSDNKCSGWRTIKTNVCFGEYLHYTALRWIIRLSH